MKLNKIYVHPYRVKKGKRVRLKKCKKILLFTQSLVVLSSQIVYLLAWSSLL
jgi:hypothetical protein